jgi:hypothetical protein
LESHGHVVGVVVFGPADLKVTLDDQAFRPLQSNKDGSFMVKNVGRIDPAYLAGHSPNAPSASATGFKSKASAFSYFPKVFGDAVAPGQRFELQLGDEANPQVIAVRQQPVQTVAIAQNNPLPDTPPLFKYVGQRLDQLRAPGSEFDARLAAITDGIRMVEAAFQTDLVNQVHLIDMNEKNNALTSEGSSSIWFYIETVLTPSLEELRRMAAHETLHQLVYRLRLTHSSRARQFFADLWGLDALSVARFQMVTTGWFDSSNASLSPKSGLFFAFINEKNFMHGMHGGHSHDNLDEFLTSFIHTLLYLEKLAPNLQLPVTLSSAQPAQALNDDDRRRLLDWYKESIQLIMQAANTGATRDPSAEMRMRTFDAFLQDCRALVERVNAGRQGSVSILSER